MRVKATVAKVVKQDVPGLPRQVHYSFHKRHHNVFQNLRVACIIYKVCVVIVKRKAIVHQVFQM